MRDRFDRDIRYGLFLSGGGPEGFALRVDGANTLKECKSKADARLTEELKADRPDHLQDAR